MTQIEKSSVFKQLKFESVDDFNIALTQFADTLKAEGRPVGDELERPDETKVISVENLKLFRAYVQRALSTPALPESAPVPTEPEAKPDISLTSTQPQSISTNTEYSRDRLGGLTNVLIQLGFELGQMVGTALSDEKWDAIEEAYEANDTRRLGEFLDSHRDEFGSVESLILSMDERRATRRAKTVGNLTGLGDLSDLTKRRQAITSR